MLFLCSLAVGCTTQKPNLRDQTFKLCLEYNDARFCSRLADRVAWEVEHGKLKRRPCNSPPLTLDWMYNEPGVQ
jgi:hypothetical protein